jgi:cellulose synthase/poly-beta-1,6-N-acetylglucosamine synthase-like glycosyltransferase
MEAFEEDMLLMLDSDMVFTPQDVGKLLNALRSHPECGAISGDYIMRNGTHLPTCDWRHPEEDGWLSDDDRHKLAEKHREHGGLTYVDSFGAGFLAITQEAKQKLGSPWFKTTEDKRGNFVGEDMFFLERLQEAGYKPAVHFGIPVGHVGHTVFRPGGNGG